ncbi:hypothetical protein QBC36DRAFT_91786 [Triangularia setosa]|uniref:Transmembrane protein n=1 Tax=Triangularia setosa TaxID=2587417 RepID=A0AAN7A9B2_9PEZI|nr:hypothetical protein QBC36DRAFT_91786 [Podospora setosa]
MSTSMMSMSTTSRRSWHSELKSIANSCKKASSKNQHFDEAFIFPSLFATFHFTIFGIGIGHSYVCMCVAGGKGGWFGLVGGIWCIHNFCLRNFFGFGFDV